MQEKEKWFLWEDANRSPFMNMALDELLLENAPGLNKPLIRIYGWDRPSISIGYVQDYFAAKKTGFTIVRRPTGGGIVYHDNDLTYTAVIPASHPINNLDRMESYHVFHRAAMRALAHFGLEASLAQAETPTPDRATMKCFTTPTRYDLICEDKKLAGAAQRRTKNGILHQGSISLDASNGDKKRLAEKLKAGIVDEFMIDFVEFKPEESFIKQASGLSDEKYASDKWNIEKTIK
jgi:lipoate-protein ligase A